MKLLLRNPNTHEELDNKLFQLLQLLRRSQPYSDCAPKVREIIESVVGQQDDKSPTGQKEGTYCLIRPTWEADWKRHGRVMTAWFDDRVCGDKIADALHAASTELVRSVLDAVEDYSEQEYTDQLSAALSKYLRLRGFPLKHPEESLSEARTNVLEAMKKMKEEGQLPARASAIALVAGYRDHCRRILAELVRRKLIVKGRRGYDLK